MNINDRISKIIEYSSLTPSEFADEIEVQRSSISHITSGRNKPSLDFIVKIKNKYPELSWDWLINDEGEMLQKKDEETQVPEIQKQKTSLPDLFNLINDENFGVTEREDKIQKEVPKEIASELPKIESNPKQNILSDSQRLEKKAEIATEIPQKKKIKRVLLFFDDQTFESFES